MYTDNNPLTYILTTAKLDATGQRWVASFANYKVKIFYKSRKIKCRSGCFTMHPSGEYTSGECRAIDCQDNATVKAEI